LAEELLERKSLEADEADLVIEIARGAATEEDLDTLYALRRGRGPRPTD
jgi:hypothetical protein